MINNEPNHKLRKDILTLFPKLETRTFIWQINWVSRQRVAQLVNILFDKKTIKFIDKRRRQYASNSIKTKK